MFCLSTYKEHHVAQGTMTSHIMNEANGEEGVFLAIA